MCRIFYCAETQGSTDGKLKFYWSLIALEIVRRHCTYNHKKLTLLNRKLVWKIADVPLLGFVVKHHFMCFFGAVLMLGSGLSPWLFTQRKCGLFTSRDIFRILVGSGLEWISRVGKPSCVWWWAGSLGKLPWGSVGSFRSSQPGLRPPKRRTERPSQVEWGKTRQKMAMFFPNFLTRLVG